MIKHSYTNNRKCFQVIDDIMDGLTCGAHAIRDIRESTFGIEDKFTDNVEVKLELMENPEYGGILISVNGGEERKRIEDPSVTKERVAAGKPIKHVTKRGWHLSFHFDWKAGHLTMKHQGVNAEKLPPVIPSQQICRNKIVDTETPDLR